MHPSTPHGTKFEPSRELCDSFRRRVNEAAEGEGTTVLSLPAPAGNPEALLRLFPEKNGFVWNPPHGARFAGAGTARSIEPTGEGRIGALLDASRRLWKEVSTSAQAGCAPSPPALFGGLAFESGGAEDPPWRSFSDGSFVLPRWLYGVEGGRGWLSLAVRGGRDRDRAAALAGELRRILDRFERPPSARPSPPPKATLHQMDRPAWAHLVAAIREEIRNDRLSKVVLARRAIADLSKRVDPIAVFRRLRAFYPDCHVFLFRRGGASFLGATPERLIWKKGKEIATEALAGSIGAAGEDAERRLRTIELLESRKDLGEHQLVVDSIRRKLGPLCSELRLPARPQIRELRNVMHLHSPMRGILARETHIVELIASLHPTPSVGGVPTADAVRWIVRNEPDRRGWYAGPIGWFDADGNGDLAVALRSGVLHERRAYLYAGAGIVRDSDPEKEYDETSIKQMPIIRALGISS